MALVGEVPESRIWVSMDLWRVLVPAAGCLVVNMGGKWAGQVGRAMIVQGVSAREEEAPRTLEAVHESQEKPAVVVAVVKVERIVTEAAEGKAGRVWQAISLAAGLHRHPEVEQTRGRPGWMHDVSKHTGHLCSRDWRW